MAAKKTKSKRGVPKRTQRKPRAAGPKATPKAKKRWRKRRLVAWSALAVAAVTLALALYGRRQWQLDARGVPNDATIIQLSWPPNLSAAEAADLLVDLGLAESDPTLRWLLLAHGTVDCAAEGPHLLPTGASPAALHARLCRTSNRPVGRLVVPEGFTRFAIAVRLERAGICGREAFVRASRHRALLHELGVPPGPVSHVESVEGYLFPATYKLPVDSPPASVVRALGREGNRRIDSLLSRYPEGEALLRNDYALGRHGLVTLASIVEREAVVPEERPIIASVFLNRLKDPAFGKLQSDPTAMYGCLVLGDRVPACRNYGGKASGAINRDRANIYSTYVIAGLPPGPIANPGEDSLRAVLAPADTDYRFFVARGGGRHTFTKTYAEHKKAIKDGKRTKGQRAAPSPN